MEFGDQPTKPGGAGKTLEMAHRVDMPEEFKLKFGQHSSEVGKSRSRKARVTNLTVLFWDLNIYMNTLGISKDEVNKVKAKKLEERGGFDKGILQTYGDKSKLVRDRIPNLPTDESLPVYSYMTLNNDERLEKLDQKLVEECDELMKATDRHKREEELADIQEVLAAMMKFRNIQMNEITPRLQVMEDIRTMEKRRKHTRGRAI